MMRHPSTIVVAVNGTESEETLSYVEPLARAWDAELLIVEVVPPPEASAAVVPLLTFHEGFAVLERERVANDYVQRVAADLRGRGIRARGIVDHGRAQAELSACADNLQASMVALATHGRQGLSRLVEGSVTESVLRRGGPATFIARIPEDAEPRRGDKRIKHILVPVDGTDEALRAIPITASLAHAYGAEVSTVHFVSAYARQKAMKHGQQHLEAATAMLKQLGIEAQPSLRRGDPTEGIVRFGLYEPAGPKIDLVVMAASTHEAPAHWFEKSTTLGVLREGVVPMVVVPSAA